MRILVIGDVVGAPGRRLVATWVPKLRQERNLCFVVANGENCAHGAGLTGPTVAALLNAGVDVVTTGDHVWDQKGFESFVEQEPRVLRPLNSAPGTPGHGSVVVPVEGAAVAVINLVGRVFMPACECPFRAVEAELERLRGQTPVIIVDIHAEATSEKRALAWFLDGRVSAVVGTHTHVPTADEEILPRGTAFITDVGMTGPHDSVLGRDKEAVIRRFLTLRPQKLEVAEGDLRLNGVIVEVDEKSGRALHIERLRA